MQTYSVNDDRPVTICLKFGDSKPCIFFFTRIIIIFFVWVQKMCFLLNNLDVYTPFPKEKKNVCFFLMPENPYALKTFENVET